MSTINMIAMLILCHIIGMMMKDDDQPIHKCGYYTIPAGMIIVSTALWGVNWLLCVR